MTATTSFLTKISPNAQKVLAKRYLTRGPDGQPLETVEQLFRRVAKAIASAEDHFPGSPYKPDQLEALFFELMTSLDFLPNSPTLMNAGKPLGQPLAAMARFGRTRWTAAQAPGIGRRPELD